MKGEAQIVVGPDGTVLAATGELPPELAGAHLEDIQGLSREIREAGKALLHQLRRSHDRVLTRSLALDDGRRVQLVVLEALALRRTATDVRTLLASKLNVLSSQARAANVTLRVAIADEVPAIVHLDAEKVAWAVTTLVGNSLRYMQTGSRRISGGTIDVRAGFDPASAQLTIEVGDDGPGIPADTVARLFKRDSLNVRGAGLALLLMSEICVAHGGAVEVRSNIDVNGHGTTVRLMLPT